MRFLVVVAALLQASDGARIKRKRSFATSPIECPNDVKLNTKGDCVDSATLRPVHASCCDSMPDCNLDDIFWKVITRLGIYGSQCSVEMGDFENDLSGKVCSAACQSVEELATRLVFDMEELEASCKNRKSELESLKIHVGMLERLDDEWSSCPPTTTSSAPTGACSKLRLEESDGVPGIVGAYEYKGNCEYMDQPMYECATCSPVVRAYWIKFGRQAGKGQWLVGTGNCEGLHGHVLLKNHVQWKQDVGQFMPLWEVPQWHESNHSYYGSYGWHSSRARFVCEDP